MNNLRPFSNTSIMLPSIGLGCMSMSHAYGVPDDVESIATLEEAIEIGVTFWDTADVYGSGKNEELLAKVLKQHRSKVFLATKFGFRQGGKDGYTFVFDASPAYMRTAVENSLRRLQTDVIDLYYAHRIDPNIPVEEMVGAMANLVTEGKVRFLGLSEASPNSLRRACSVHQIAALQSEYSILTREPEKEVIPTCKELGITFVPFSPLARGLMTNTLSLDNIPDGDFRKNLPRYTPAHAENNTKLAKAFAEFAYSKQCTPAQLALAWVLAQGEHIIPIPGTKRRKYLNDNVGALNVVLSADDLLTIDNLLLQFPNIGDRYNEQNKRFVDKN